MCGSAVFDGALSETARTVAWAEPIRPSSPLARTRATTPSGVAGMSAGTDTAYVSVPLPSAPAGIVPTGALAKPDETVAVTGLPFSVTLSGINVVPAGIPSAIVAPGTAPPPLA